jgi:hypothetical protein
MSDPKGKSLLPLSKKPPGNLLLAPVIHPAIGDLPALIKPPARVPSAASVAAMKRSADEALSMFSSMTAVRSAADLEENVSNLKAYTAAVDSLVPFYGDPKKWNSTAVKIEESTGYNNVTLRRHAQNVVELNARVADGCVIAESEYDRAYGRVKGKRPRASPAVMAALQAHIDKSAVSGDALKKIGATRSVFLSPQFNPTVQNCHRTVVESLIKSENTALHGASHSNKFKVISAPTLRKIMAATTKPKPVTSDTSTKRRRAARADLGNPISLACAVAFINRWPSGLGVSQDTIPWELWTNYDQSSVYLNDDGKMEVFIGEASSKDLKKQSASIKTSKLGEAVDGGYGNNNRCYGYATLTTGSGELLMYLQIVKDKCYLAEEVLAASVSSSPPPPFRLETWDATNTPPFSLLFPHQYDEARRIYALFCSSKTSKEEIATMIFSNFVCPLLIDYRKRVLDSANRALQPIKNTLATLLRIAGDDDDDDDDDDYVGSEQSDDEGERARASLFDDSSSDNDEEKTSAEKKLLDELYLPVYSECPSQLEFPSPFETSTTATLDSATLKFTPTEQVKLNQVLNQSDSTSATQLQKDVGELYMLLLAKGLGLRKSCVDPPDAFEDDASGFKIPKRMVFTLDGDLEQIRTITELLFPLTKQQRLEVLKFAGGSSSFQQPNDLMKGFMIFRRFILSPQYKSWNPSKDTPSSSLQKLEMKFVADKMEKASMEGYLKIFRSLDFIVPRAWSVVNVQKGWEIFKSASPGEYDSILEMSTRWPLLSEAQKQKVRDSIHPLAETMATNRGLLDESIMQNMLGSEILGEEPAVEASIESDSESESEPESDSESARPGKRQEEGGRKRGPPRAVKPLAELILNRQRAVVVSSNRARFTVAVRAKIKALKAIHTDLKKMIAELPPPPPPRQSAPDGSSSSSSFSSSSAAAATVSGAATASGVPRPVTPTEDSVNPTRVTASKLKKVCESSSCSVEVPRGLARCNYCYMTFCEACSSADLIALHHKSMMCKKKSNRM